MFIRLGMADLAVGLGVHGAARPRPMRFPPRPHCGAPDGPWGFPRGTAPAREAAKTCGRCGATTLIVYRRRPVDAASAFPSFLLRWPTPLGIRARIR